MSTWKHGILPGLVLSLGCAALAQSDRISGAIENSRSVPLAGNVTPQARPKFDRGPVAPEFQLKSITLVLKPDAAQRAALDQLLEDQQNPASPDFRKWLTPEQFADRFGASRNDIARLSGWLRMQGFTLQSTARGRDWIAFSGTAAEVEKAFRTTVHLYDVDGHLHFGIATEPSLPSALEPLVESVLGLDDFLPERSRVLRPDATLSNGQITVTPDDLKTIYDVRRLHDAGIDGAGQKIVVVGNSAVNVADIQAFRQLYGIPNAAIQQVLAGPDPGLKPQLLPEADLDLEWSGAIAPKATLIYVYSSDLNMAIFHAIDQNLAPVLSESFGVCEQKVTAALSSSYEAEAKKANAMGITWIVATGDTGAANCDHAGALATSGLAVSFPSNLPEVTAVGGAEFSEGTGAGSFWNATNNAAGGSAQSYVPEMAWNDSVYVGYLSAGGGGVSTVFPKPSWQTGAGVPNDHARDLPDVSLDAGNAHDPYTIVTGGHLQAVGGTSASAPVFAGMVALLNQSLQTAGAGNINPNLYRLAQSTPAMFHDIVAGSNMVPCEAESPNCSNGQFGYSAGPGYDLATGLGSVDAYNLVTGWNGTPADTPAATGVVPSSTTAGGASFALTVHGANFAAGAQAQWNGAGLPTTIVSATELQAMVDASLIASPGIASITVVQNGKGSGALYFTIHADASMGITFGGQRVTKSPPVGCDPPTPGDSFVTSDTTIYVWFQAILTANDRLVISWLAPDSTTYLTVFAALKPGSNYCGLSTTLNIGHLPASQLGAWQVRLYDNATQLFSVPFSVTLPGAVAPTVASVVNGASFKQGAAVAPGSLATIFGTGFAAQIYASTIPLPTELSGVSVIVNGRAAPIVFLNETQINFELPLETPAGTATVVVETNGVPSASFQFPVQAVAPGLFVALNNADGSPNGPAHPASTGDFLVVYMTGQGHVSLPVADGVPTPNPPPLANATASFSATIGGAKATVTFLGLSPGFVGLAQADVQAPKLGAGTYPLVITVGGVQSNQLMISVR